MEFLDLGAVIITLVPVFPVMPASSAEEKVRILCIVLRTMMLSFSKSMSFHCSAQSSPIRIPLQPDSSTPRLVSSPSCALFIRCSSSFLSSRPSGGCGICALAGEVTEGSSGLLQRNFFPRKWKIWLVITWIWCLYAPEYCFFCFPPSPKSGRITEGSVSNPPAGCDPHRGRICFSVMER